MEIFNQEFNVFFYEYLTLFNKKNTIQIYPKFDEAKGTSLYINVKLFGRTFEGKIDKNLVFDGKITYEDGSFYYGTLLYLNFPIKGTGTFVDFFNEVVYEGLWENGVGKGKMTINGETKDNTTWNVLLNENFKTE